MLFKKKKQEKCRLPRFGHELKFLIKKKNRISRVNKATEIPGAERNRRLTKAALVE